jgi:hypothetical protein
VSKTFKSKPLISFLNYFYSSTELEKSAQQVLLGSEEGGGERVEAGAAGGRNDLNNVCTFE